MSCTVGLFFAFLVFLTGCTPRFDPQNLQDRASARSLKEEAQKGDQAALSQLTEKAQKGQPAAEAQLGNYFFDKVEANNIDYTADTNYTAAIDWWKKAAKAGYAPSAYNLGMYYHTHPADGLNDYEAVKWFRMAGESGERESRFQLWDIWFRDSVNFAYHHPPRPVPLSSSEAYKWLRLAGQQGHVTAACYLSNSYGYDKGGHGINYAQAYFWSKVCKRLLMENHDTLAASLEKDFNRYSALLSEAKRTEIDAQVAAWKPAAIIWPQ